MLSFSSLPQHLIDPNAPGTGHRPSWIQQVLFHTGKCCAQELRKQRPRMEEVFNSLENYFRDGCPTTGQPWAQGPGDFRDDCPTTGQPWAQGRDEDDQLRLVEDHFGQGRHQQRESKSSSGLVNNNNIPEITELMEYHHPVLLKK